MVLPNRRGMQELLCLSPSPSLEGYSLHPLLSSRYSFSAASSLTTLPLFLPTGITDFQNFWKTSASGPQKRLKCSLILHEFSFHLFISSLIEQTALGFPGGGGGG